MQIPILGNGTFLMFQMATTHKDSAPKLGGGNLTELVLQNNTDTHTHTYTQTFTHTCTQ